MIEASVIMLGPHHNRALLDIRVVFLTIVLLQGRLHHSRRIRLTKVPDRNALVEQEVDLLQCLSLALRYTEVHKDDSDRHETAKDEANLAVQAGVLVVDEVWDDEVDSEAASTR